MAERRRAVALARHFREAEGLSIAEIAERLGRSPATVKAYFYDPTGEKARAVKARYLGICRGCGAYTQPRNGKGDAYAYCKACHPGAIERRWTAELVLQRCWSGASVTAGCLPPMTGRAPTPVAVVASPLVERRIDHGASGLHVDPPAEVVAAQADHRDLHPGVAEPTRCDHRACASHCRCDPLAASRLIALAKRLDVGVEVPRLEELGGRICVRTDTACA